MKEHWIVINTLSDCLENGINSDTLKKAIFKLSVALDERVIDNQPTQEVAALLQVLERVNYDICNHE